MLNTPPAFPAHFHSAILQCVFNRARDAIRLYEHMGATVMPDWRICRVTGTALDAFASSPAGSGG